MWHVVHRKGVDSELHRGGWKQSIYTDGVGLIEFGRKDLKVWGIGGSWDRGLCDYEGG